MCLSPSAYLGGLSHNERVGLADLEDVPHAAGAAAARTAAQRGAHAAHGVHPEPDQQQGRAELHQLGHPRSLADVLHLQRC